MVTNVLLNDASQDVLPFLAACSADKQKASTSTRSVSFSLQHGAMRSNEQPSNLETRTVKASKKTIEAASARYRKKKGPQRDSNFLERNSSTDPSATFQTFRCRHWWPDEHAWCSQAVLDIDAAVSTISLVRHFNSIFHGLSAGKSEVLAGRMS